MDSFFKAAVCDLDKLLDDFELNTEELECKAVFLKPPSYPFSSLGPQCLPPDAPPGLPDLNALHYGSTSGGSQQREAEEREAAAARPLTGVDLLSSVDRGAAKSSAPPCPDRALKPVCDLVNDASSAILVRADSHDAFGELDAAERRLEEEQQAGEEGGAGEGVREALLVDFDSPVEQSATSAGLLALHPGSSAPLSLLDVILPAAVERGGEPAGVPPTAGGPPDVEEHDQVEDSGNPSESVGGSEETPEPPESKEEERSEEAESPGPSHGAAVGLSCLPMAVSMCGALVKQSAAAGESEEAEEQREEVEERREEVEERRDEAEERGEEERGEGVEEAEVSESTEADAADSREVESRAEAIRDASPEPAGGRSSPEGRGGCPVDPAQPSPPDPPEFGFEYLPESDQAELLVTDEELDAFLQAHVEAERHAPRCSSQPEALSGGGHEDPEALSCPESERNAVCPDPAAGSQSSPQHSGGPRQPPPYGGARPKQPHCHTATPPPAGGEEGEEEEEEEGEGGSTAAPGGLDNQEAPQAGPAPAEELPDCSPAYDELSEPPPYPGEPDPPTAAAADSLRGEGPAEEEPGSRQPEWVPDADAPNCMNCEQRFTFTRRRHHCRACGKVYCAGCCNRKCKLKYLEKEARVCVTCFESIHKAQALERMMSPTGPSPNPNVPSEYCSTIPPLQQARAAGTLNSPPPTVMVPVSVLKHPNNDSCPREQKRVWFADGILPNGEVADTSRLSVASRRSSQEFGGVSPDPSAPGSAVGLGGPSAPEASGTAEVVRAPVSGPWDYALLAGIGSLVNRVPSLLPENEDELPPLLITTGEEDDDGGGGGGGDVLVAESPAPCQILHLLEEGGPRPLTFVLNANLLVNVKLVTYCSRPCWCFGSVGLQALGQKELVFVLECLPEEKTLPRDLFTLYLTVYQDALKGRFVGELDNVTFTSSFLGSKDHGGMLFFSPSCQPLDGLALPPPPFLLGLLVQKLEVPWAKVFPLRLLLRLGAQYQVYPTAVMSIRFRDSVYRETGHTIMNLLADLRNYQYSLPVVEGLRIHMEMGHSYIDIPKSSFSEMQKVVNSSNEHVISVGASFSSAADSHLVCFQNEEGNYQTQASSMPGKTRTVTGASFVVFNGALKASSGFIAKSSIVEDGLMVQIPPETMEALRAALREQNHFTIPCGKNDGGELRENVTVRWVDWKPETNTGRSSGVDGRSLDGVHSVRMQQDAEFESNGRSIRCTEVFYQLKSADSSLPSVLASCGVFQKEMAVATCSALTPHLSVLTCSGINSLSLRVSTQADMVEYQAGSGGRLLPQRYMNEMDSALIPVIHGGGASVPQTAMDMEFTFYITHVI
ncbi:zinc finger FYVE domain-containing protein 16 isoform X2 [Salarias fasciatus]|uniref:zinc finger FYVE domain-containing protein 16 isoform X2 n=1 Tax=Salarias fasciatus TaxID=181472 RepID=UPI0011766F97|nr:zinc finger FYVE domain-containing protein 16-like isoform X2 [Salarias fasciatus]